MIWISGLYLVNIHLCIFIISWLYSVLNILVQTFDFVVTLPVGFVNQSLYDAKYIYAKYY